MAVEFNLDKFVASEDADGDGIINNAGEIIRYEFDLVNSSDAGERLVNPLLTNPLLGFADLDVVAEAAAGNLIILGDTNDDGVIDPGETWFLTTEDPDNPGTIVSDLFSYEVTQDDFDSNGTDEPNDVNPGLIDNTATATAQRESDGATFIASGSAGVDIVLEPDIDIDKQVDAVLNPDDSTDSDGVVDEAGDQIVYDVVVTNTGNITLNNVEVTDPLLGGTIGTIASLAPGETFTVDDVVYTVEQGDLDGNGIDLNGDPDDDGDIDNTSTADSDEAGPVSDSEEVLIDFNPDLTFDKVVTGVDTAGDGVLNNAGEIINYDLVATNDGNVTLTNVTLVDPLTGTDINIGDLAPGDTHIESTSYAITQADLDSNGTEEPDNVQAGTIDNTAVADSDQTDPVDDSEMVPIEPPAPPGGANTIGFWSRWDGIFEQELANEGLSPDDLYEDVFSVDLTGRLDGITLGEAIEVRGGLDAQLVAQSTAALANAASDEASYSYLGFEAELEARGVLSTLLLIDGSTGGGDNGVIEIDEIFEAVQDALDDDDATNDFFSGKDGIEDVKDAFDGMNEVLPEVDAMDFMAA